MKTYLLIEEVDYLYMMNHFLYRKNHHMFH